MNELYEYRNAWIDFTVPTIGTHLDNLGNVCPNQLILRYDAFLKVDTGKTAIDEKKFLGIDLNVRSMQGYVFRLFEPTSLPVEVAPNTWYRGVFGVEPGWFYLRSNGRYGRAGIDEIIEEYLDTSVQMFFQTKATP